MILFRLGLLFIIGSGLGFGINQFTENTVNNNFEQGHCYQEDFNFNDMIISLSEEDQMLIEEKLNELLLEYGITIEDFNSNIEIRRNVMFNLVNFMMENDIDFSFGSNQEFDGDNYWPGRMWMHQ